jgi:sulfur carrier protein ThiS
MHVHVKLFSRFREYLPTEARGEARVELRDSATVADLLDHLNIGQRVKLITINDEPATNQEQTLHDSDIVHIFPVVVGG